MWHREPDVSRIVSTEVFGWPACRNGGRNSSWDLVSMAIGLAKNVAMRNWRTSGSVELKETDTT